MKYAFLFAAALMVAMTSCDKKGSSGSDLKTHKDSLSYALGVSVAQSLKDGDLTEFDYDVFFNAMKEFRDSSESMDMTTADTFLREEFMKKANAEADVAKQKGVDFLAENKNKEGIQTTASGLQYKVISEGTGIQPDENDSVTVNYHGTLMDGTVFDSSRDRGEPATFVLNRVIPGWTEGVKMMHEGSKYMLWIPQELGYGSRASGAIPAYAPLVFEVELIKVKKND